MAPKARTRRRGRLAEATVLAPTRRRYDQALAAFFRYLDSYRLPLPDNKLALDLRGADFVQYLYEEGYSKQHARDLGSTA